MENNSTNLNQKTTRKVAAAVAVVAVFFVLAAFVSYLSDLKGSIGGVESTLKDLNNTLTSLDKRLENQENLTTSLQQEGYVEKPGLSFVSKSVFPSVVFILGSNSESASLDFNSGNKILTNINYADVRGTGFFVSSDGFIATAKHVISNLDPNSITIKENVNGNIHKAKVVKISELSDIAILKIIGTNYSPVTLGHFENIKIGDEIGFIGFNPGINIPLVNSGNVSATGQDNLLKIFTINSFVNRGNSGSPVFSIATGRVIGLISSRKPEQTNRQPLDLEKFRSGMKIGNIDPLRLSAELYNDILKLTEETTQVGIGIVYSVDEIDELIRTSQ